MLLQVKRRDSEAYKQRPFSKGIQVILKFWSLRRGFRILPL